MLGRMNNVAIYNKKRVTVNNKVQGREMNKLSATHILKIGIQYWFITFKYEGFSKN